MKTGWWIVIGIAVVAVIIFIVYKNKMKVSGGSGVAPLVIDGTPCTLASSSRSALPNVILPTVTQGVIKNGVCVAA